MTKIISAQIGTDIAIPVATPRAVKVAALSVSQCAISGSASVVIVADMDSTSRVDGKSLPAMRFWIVKPCGLFEA